MDYFCYISRGKIDQLYNNYNISDVDEWTESKIVENEVGVNAGADWSIAQIIQLFKGQISYGRKGVVQRERKIKIHYVRKLKDVMLAISNEQTIPSLLTAYDSNNFENRFYHYEGQFNIVEPLDINSATSAKVITISSKCRNLTLLLDCSLRYFSEGNEPDGTFSVHSGNYSFFVRGLSLPLETSFILLNRENHQLIGTPLYLKLLLTQLQIDEETDIQPAL